MIGTSFGSKDPLQKLSLLLSEFEDFKKDTLNEYKANNLSVNLWHLIEWVYYGFPHIHNKPHINQLQDELSNQCPSLRLMHDIATESKHFTVSKPKTTVKNSKIHFGPFSNVFGRAFDQSYLEIEMGNGTKLYYIDEVEIVVKFWVSYFDNILRIRK